MVVKCSDLVSRLRQTGYVVKLLIIEIGAKGLVSNDVYDVLKLLGMKGQQRAWAEISW